MEYGLEKEELENKNNSLILEKQEKEKQLEDAKSILEQYHTNQKLLEEFLKKDGKYLENRFLYNEILAELEKLENQVAKESEQIEQYRNDMDGYTQQQAVIKQRLRDYEEKHVKYQDVTEGTLIEEQLLVLENEYNQLTSKLNQTVQNIEKSIDEKKTTLNRYLGEIRELDLKKEDYSEVNYEESILDVYKQQNSELKKVFESVESIRLLSHDRTIKARTNFDNALMKLMEQGMTEPLPKKAIEQNYQNRRRVIKSKISETSERRKLLSERKTLCDTKSGILTSLIEPDHQKASLSKFLLEDNINEQFDLHVKYFKESRQASASAKNEFTKIFKKIKEQYESTHISIKDILGSLDSLVNGNLMENISYEKVYFYTEELVKKREVLGKLLDYYHQKLAIVDDTKRQVIVQCLSYATLIYEDMKLISERSKVRLANKARAIQMLKIGIPTEIDSGAESRMNDYIELTMNTLITYLNNPENTKDKRYKDKVRNMMATRILINQLIGKEQVPVHIYKIELNEANNGMKTWEDAMKENSGGEKFVCFFTVASTLISYTREATGKKIRQESMDGRAMNESKVMIMDNPFARTSSEHLLKAVIDIAKTFNIQLICLSDLSQSSITNRFNLIFSLSIRQRMYSDREVLYVEKPQINHEGLREDERLEHVTLHQTYEQVGLFDDLEF